MLQYSVGLTLSTLFSQLFRGSELFYRDGPSMKNVSFVEGTKNCYIYKTVNNNFKKQHWSTTNRHSEKQLIDYTKKMCQRVN